MPLQRDAYGNAAQLINIARTQNVTVAGANAQSSAFQTGTRFVRLISTTDCWILFGSNPTALTSSIFLPAGVVEVFPVNGGEKVAALQNTVGGTLNIGEDA